MFKYLYNKLFPTKVLPNKDPNDFTLTKSSTSWVTQRYFCKKCKSETSHREFMSNICNSCGSFEHQELNYKIHRYIYLDGKWVKQAKLKTGEIYFEKN